MFGLNNRGQSEFDANVAWAVLSGVAVAIRLFCKIRSKQGIGSDDYCILAALIFYYTAVACAMWGIIAGGGGMEMEQILLLAKKNPAKLHVLSNYLESLFLAYTFVLTSTYCVKVSICLFYRRIFFVTTGYKQISTGLIVLSTMWFIAAQTANLLTCQPIDSFWNRLKPGKCFSFSAMYLGTGVIDAVIDVAILLLPIRMAFRLHLPTRNRVAVAGIFSLGGFVVVAQIVRLIYIYQPHSQYVKFYEAEQWTNIHDATAIICACLPLYKPVWSSLSNFLSKTFSYYANSNRSKTDESKSKASTGNMVHLGEFGSARELKNSGSYDQQRKSESAHTDQSLKGGLDDDIEFLTVPQTCSRTPRGMDTV